MIIELYAKKLFNNIYFYPVCKTAKLLASDLMRQKSLTLKQVESLEKSGISIKLVGAVDGLQYLLKRPGNQASLSIV